MQITEAPYSRADLYDAAAYGVDPLALQWLLENFEIVSRPRGRIGTPLRRGDILLRRGEGSLAHACAIVDPEFRTGLEVSLQGGTVEFGGPGHFVFVAERGARPHEEHERFARRVTDSSGRVLGKQFVLRPRESAGEGDAERIDPMSIMVGMTLAQQMTPPRPTQVTVVSPTPEKPAGEWAAPNFESEFAECSDQHHAESSADLSWPASCHRHAHGDAAHGDSESDANALGEFASPEHYRLGDSVQALVNSWAKAGLVSGGCFVLDEEPDGRPLPLAQWQYFLPDRKNLAHPYGNDPRATGRANWHWIAPNALHDANGHPWTAQTLGSAVINGHALTMSVGDLIMTSGDIVGEFTEYGAAANASWHALPVNIARGLAQGEGFAHCIIRRLVFPRTGLDARHDVQMIAQAHKNSAAVGHDATTSTSDKRWVATRSLIAYLTRARGTTGYHQLRVLIRLQRHPRLITAQNIERVAPWMSGAASAFLHDAAAVDPHFRADTPIDSDVFQMIVSNGTYAELALGNELHFGPSFFPPDRAHPTPMPGNWPAFEVAHATALRMIDTLATRTGSLTSEEHGPIPGDAIAQLAHGLHFLTDAFASGHMRVPRHQLGPQGSILSGVMHDLDNSVGLTVTNGFNDRWHAFGDGHLETSTAGQLHLLAELAAASTRSGVPINPDFNANRDHAFNAVTAAMKQLHYQAQKYFGDPSHSVQYQTILRDNRGTTAGLAHDDILSHQPPGDGSSRDAWIAMDIPAKTAYMRKHRPVPIAGGAEWRRTGTFNHPALVTTDATGSLVVYNTHDYALDQHLATDHALYEIDLTTAHEFKQDITKYVLLSVLTPASAQAWAGTREVYLPRAIATWPDHRGTVDAILRWAAGLSDLHLP